MRKFLLTTTAGFAALGLAACDVEQTEEGEAPEVDVEAQGGNMPEYDVDTADVDVGSEERRVEVPTLDVEEAEADEAQAETQ